MTTIATGNPAHRTKINFKKYRAWPPAAQNRNFISKKKKKTKESTQI